MTQIDWDQISLPGMTFQETIRYLYQGQGMSMSEAADKLGVDKDSLRRKMDALGIPRRPPGWGTGRRDRVFEYLDTHGLQTAREIATALSIPFHGARRYKMLYGRKAHGGKENKRVV